MKHEYTFEELAELKKIYDESGEAGLSRDEMRALCKAGLLTQGLPEKPSKRDLILAHCKKRISQGQPFDGKETAEALGLSPKTVGNILGQLRKEGLLPAFDKHSPRSKAQKTTTSGKKKETMTTESKITAADVTESKLTVNDVTTGTSSVRPQATDDPRAIISNAISLMFDHISGIGPSVENLGKTAFDANEKVAYGYYCAILQSEKYKRLQDAAASFLSDGKLMDIKANYSKENK